PIRRVAVRLFKRRGAAGQQARRGGAARRGGGNPRGGGGSFFIFCLGPIPQTALCGHFLWRCLRRRQRSVWAVAFPVGGRPRPFFVAPSATGIFFVAS